MVIAALRCGGSKNGDAFHIQSWSLRLWAAMHVEAFARFSHTGILSSQAV